MALSDILSDIYASLSFTEIHAETPPQEEEADEGGDDDKEESEGKGGEEDGDADGGEGSDEGGDDEGGEEEEEEEEEEEPEDPFPKLQEECSKSAQCASLKHHYDECADRVTRQHQNPDHKGPKEDCVEECESALSPETANPSKGFRYYWNPNQQQ